MSRSVPQPPASSPNGRFRRRHIVCAKAPALPALAGEATVVTSTCTQAASDEGSLSTGVASMCASHHGSTKAASDEGTLSTGAASMCTSHHESTKAASDEGALSSVATDEEFSVSLWGRQDTPGVSAVDDFAAQTAICFDWDDTFFPTRFIYKVVEPWMEEHGVESLKDTPFYEQLSQHARYIEDVIRTACSLGRVCIVTLAQRSWVSRCVELYLPGLDLHQLLTTLSIPVMYARDFLNSRVVTAAEGEGGVNLQAVAKMRAMTKALQRFSATGSTMTNWISIGDSSAERDALMECAWSHDEEADQKILCKTVKFLKGPNMQELEAQLQVLLAMLPRVVFSLKDQDIVVEDHWSA